MTHLLITDEGFFFPRGRAGFNGWQDIGTNASEVELRRENDFYLDEWGTKTSRFEV